MKGMERKKIMDPMQNQPHTEPGSDQFSYKQGGDEPENGQSGGTSPNGSFYGSEFPANPKKSRRWEENPALAILKALGYFLIYLGTTVFVSMVPTVFWVLSMFRSGMEPAAIQSRVNALLSQNAMLLTIVTDVLVLAIFAAIMVCRRKNPLSLRQNRELFRPIPGSKIFYLIVMGMTLNFALTLIFFFVSPLLPEWMNQENQQTQDIYISGGFFIYILGGVILAPIVEELLLRGLMAKRFSRGMPKWLAVLIAALIFGCLHDAVIRKVYAGLLGILLGTVFFRENSLFASVALHFGFNLSSLLPTIINQWGGGSYIVLSVLFMGLCMICLPIAIVMTVLYFTALSRSRQPRAGQSPMTGGTNPY